VATVEVTATAPASPDTTLENTATVTGGNLDPDPGDAAATALVDLDTNGPPVATDDATTTPSDTPVTVPVLGNDTDPDGDGLAVVGVGEPSAGTALVNGDGTVTVTPPPGFSGDITVPYTVVDAFGQTSSATITVTVTPVPPPPPLTPPLALDDAFATDPAAPTGAVPLDLLGNDSDPDPGDALTITGLGTPADGTVVLSSDPLVCGALAVPCPVYEANPGFAGTDTFTYSVTDTQGNTTTATVTITVPNDPPTARPDESATLGATPVDIPVLLNDADFNGDPVTVTETSSPANGTVVVNPDGTITYSPTPGFLGTDAFTYTVTDGNGGTSTTTVSVTVFDNPPAAPPRQETTPPDTPIAIDLLDGVTDPDGDTPRVVDVVDPPVGTVEIADDGEITFTPPPGFTGVVPISYTITDGRGAVTEAEIVVTVQPVPEPPVTQPPVTEPPPGGPSPAPADPGPSAAPPPARSGTLPFTGADVLWLALLGAGLIGAGDLVRRQARRRRA
jgi:large repetitive protein